MTPTPKHELRRENEIPIRMRTTAATYESDGAPRRCAGASRYISARLSAYRLRLEATDGQRSRRDFVDTTKNSADWEGSD
jgi:hypothetical protein